LRSRNWRIARLIYKWSSNAFSRSVSVVAASSLVLFSGGISMTGQDAEQSAIQHAFSMDVHHEQIDLLVFEYSQNYPIRHSGLHPSNYFAPVLGFCRDEIIELLTDSAY
jgi:hypothetical protein